MMPGDSDDDTTALGGNLGGGLGGDAWRYPTTMLIAQTLYQNTAVDRMANARDNIEKIMTKLCLDAQAECIEFDDAVEVAAGEEKTWSTRSVVRYDVSKGPMGGTSLPPNSAWRWIGASGTEEEDEEPAEEAGAGGSLGGALGTRQKL